MTGTFLNIATVLLGSALGLALRGRLPDRYRETAFGAVGLVTLVVGFSLALQVTGARDVVLTLLALVVGGLLGETLNLEGRLEKLGEALKRRIGGGGRCTEGFMAASLLYCVGPLTIVGSLQDGLVGDYSLLATKAVLDGISSVALASTLGVGVAFSALVVLVYQGGLSLAASAIGQLIPDPGSDPHIALMSLVGGVMIIGLGLNILGLLRLRTANFLPALLLAAALGAFRP
ncbi:MAG: DUF554 domain-containing protein [Deinococcus sp.]|nr:DUF554 domain-containing protein [Deinococcus sp.]